MRNWTCCWAASILVVGALAVPALAFVSRTGQTVVVSEALQDDLYLAGRTVTATATVDGDVVAAGGTVDLAGEASGEVLAAGGTLTLGGAVGRTLRAAGGTVTVDSRIKSDAVLAGGTVRVGSAAQIGRDLVVGGGSVNVSGTVGRNALIGGADVVIGGTIHGDAGIQANRITLLPTARIGGALRYAADQPIEIQPGARVAGGTTRMPAPARPRAIGAPFGPRLWLWRSAAETIALLVLGLVTFAVAPRAASLVLQEIRERLGRSLIAGFVLLVTVPVAALLLVFTVVAIPVAVVGMLLYAATVYPGQVFAAAWLGYLVLSRVRGPSGRAPSAYWSVAVGVIVLVALFAIPYAGWAIRLLALFSGFGALWLTLWGALTGPPIPLQPAAPATP